MSGISVVASRKGFYLRALAPSGGCKHVDIDHCYFEGVEGEVAYGDGGTGSAMENCWFNWNHVYKVLTNVLNYGGGQILGCFNSGGKHNVIDTPGAGASCIGGGTTFVFDDNLCVWSDTNLTPGSAAIGCAASNGVSFQRNEIRGYHLDVGLAILGIGGGGSSAGVNAAVVRGNKFLDCQTIGLASLGEACIVAIDARAGDVTNFVVEGNEFIDCAEQNHGSYPNVAAIGALGGSTGGHVMKGKIGTNTIMASAGTANPVNRAVLIHDGSLVASYAVPSSNGIVVEHQVYDSSVTTPFDLMVAPLVNRAEVYGSKTWDPPSVNNGAETTTTVTVTGAALGDLVVVGFSLDLQGMKLTGYVSVAGTVTVVMRNDTGGALDLGSGTLRVRCFRS